MKKNLIKKDFPETQIKILRLLFKREYQQKELQRKLKTTGSNLHYHLNRLEDLGLIQRITLQQVGNVKINNILLNSTARQQVRQILGYEIKNFTLITGYGVLKEGYKVPDRVFKLLKEKRYPISKIICFTSPDAEAKRKEKQESEKLIEIHKTFSYNYEDYRNLGSKFFKEVESIISKEMKNADIILDLTPLSKLYTLKLLELSNKYLIPSVYCAMDEKKNYRLYSLSKMKIEGEIKLFD
ncbi:MAG: winged helix-turn-helix domain-containing protein [Promethearchaeota archaeon]